MYKKRDLSNRSNRPRNNRVNKTSILPPSNILEKYEDLAPGSAEKIIDMVDIEQDHRHKFENRALTASIISYRLGQIFGFIFLLASLAATLFLINSSADKYNAIYLFISALSFYFLITLITARTKNKFKRYKRR